MKGSISSEEPSPCDTGVQQSDTNLLNDEKTEKNTEISATESKQESKRRKRKSKKPKPEAKSDPMNGVMKASNGDDSVSTPKMNAFQFMMNSRHKSIGQNSPGRELDLNESTDSALSKKELKARKSRLESWSQQKGAAKRKREYEETGNCINSKLEKREKRMKKLLKMNCHSDDEVIVKRGRKCAVIESDSDGEVVEKSEKKGKFKRLSLNKKNDVKLTPKSVKSWKMKIKLRMDENKENGEATSSEDLVESDVVQSQNGPENGQSTSEECVLENGPENEKNSTSEECILCTDEKLEENNEKRVLRTRSKPKIYEDYLLSDSDDESNKKKKEKKEVKVAPVFLKAVPKPKLDPKLVEAKRQFLLSGMPSSLKKEMDKQQSIEEVDFDVFPTISHVQQKSLNNTFWDLPKVDLELLPTEIEEKIEIKPFSKTVLSLEQSSNLTTEENIPIKIKNCKKIIREIKSKHPEYPVYKIFNSIYSKSGYKTEMEEKKKEETKTTPKRRGRPKKKSSETNTPVKPEIKEENNLYAMWTEKYKPKSSFDIIGNHSAITELKEWLKNWLKPDSRKKKSDSESDFDVIDSDSRDSTRTSGNTVILKGPIGSGKSAAVYAICNELGFNVLEVNASSKRTGKRLLQELQEATQSHQVCKGENILSFVKETKEQVSKPKKCLLLIEDVDIVFEQDEGFVSALCQIITTSKRPVILTTTEEPGGGVQKITNEHRAINFHALSNVLTVWLQIVCLVEGFYLNLKSLEELLSYNRGDIRRTLLQLQLYVNSGGQRGNSVHVHKSSEIESAVHLDVKVDDDSSNMSKLDESSDENVTAHFDCFDGCHPVKNYDTFSLPSCNDLETIWWNWPAILNFPGPETKESSKIDKKQMQSIVDCYEAAAFADLMCGKNQFCDSLESRWRTKTKDSLGLEENMAAYKDEGFCDDLAQTVLSGSVKLYRSDYGCDVAFSKLAMDVPVARTRWRSKRLSAEDKLHQVVPLGELLSRESVSLDYMPCVRTIVRSEFERAANNTKRSNRFYHYLRNLGVRCSDSTYKMACDVFKMED